jgi:hypothetical protein
MAVINIFGAPAFGIGLWGSDMARLIFQRTRFGRKYRTPGEPMLPRRGQQNCRPYWYGFKGRVRRGRRSRLAERRKE